MEPGARVWAYEARADAWRAALVVTADGPRVEVAFEEDGATATLLLQDATTREALVCLRNEDEGEEVQDLCNLTHLHLPTILFTLQERFDADLIYTYTGPILLALNPFRRLRLYDDDILQRYATAGVQQMRGRDRAEKLPPHVYAIADAAYRAMVNPAGPEEPRDQSVLISGESGAGKTETTKIIMNYLARISDPRAAGAGGVAATAEVAPVAHKVLMSNPVLEALGNARTIRNDNSSRFGKFIEIVFRDSTPPAQAGNALPTIFELCGARIRTFLLERVRVAKHDHGERSFHIFYMLFAEGLEDYDKNDFLEGDLEDYAYLNQSDTWDRRDGLLDADLMDELLEALSAMAFSDEETRGIFRAAAAVLSLGNVAFEDIYAGTSDAAFVTADTEDALLAAASLLSVEPEALREALTFRRTVVGKETYSNQVCAADATHSRDALAKFVYQGLFEHTVRRVNEVIGADLAPAPSAAAGRFGRQRKAAAFTEAYIGLLDIFGFETFAVNGFEQFLINYANESLQHFFNQYVFETEQQEYAKEGISWTYVTFADNQATLDLVQRRNGGVLSLLDEQCLAPGGSDPRFLEALLRAHTKPDEKFFCNAQMRAAGAFGINHYAGCVSYTAEGFVEKNRDTLRTEIEQLLANSRDPLVCAYQACGAQRNNAAAMKNGVATRRGSINALSLSAKFRRQLADLLSKINQTKPHFVRCIKPNDAHEGGVFDPHRSLEQLRCGGVLAAVKVSRAGFAVRVKYRDFAARYKPLRCGVKFGYLSVAGRSPKAEGATPATPPRFTKSGAAKAAKAVATFRRSMSKGEQLLQEKNISPSRGVTPRKNAAEGGEDRVMAIELLIELLPLLAEVIDVVPVDQENLDAQLEEGAYWQDTMARAGVQCGRTKVFLREKFHAELERFRAQSLSGAAITVQRHLRGYFRAVRYQRILDAIWLIQRNVRGFSARKRVTSLRRDRAALQIQCAWRRQQACARVRSAREECVAASKISSFMRMAVDRSRYRRWHRAVVVLQAAVRRRKCRGILKKAKEEAKSVAHLEERVKGTAERLEEAEALVVRLRSLLAKHHITVDEEGFETETDESHLAPQWLRGPAKAPKLEPTEGPVEFETAIVDAEKDTWPTARALFSEEPSDENDPSKAKNVPVATVAPALDTRPPTSKAPSGGALDVMPTIKPATKKKCRPHKPPTPQFFRKRAPLPTAFANNIQ